MIWIPGGFEGLRGNCRSFVAGLLWMTTRRGGCGVALYGEKTGWGISSRSCARDPANEGQPGGAWAIFHLSLGEEVAPIDGRGVLYQRAWAELE